MIRRRPGLSGYDSSADATPQAREGRRKLRGGAKTENLPVLGGTGGCWCGDRFGHYWPGKADGIPHPSDRLELLSRGSGD